MTAKTVDGQRHDRTALILYGSETGNGQDVAEELGRVAERLHFGTRVSEMDRVELNLLPEYTVVICAISTTGQGEFPRNARRFWKSLLRKRLPPGCLDHVHFTTFGLGDSSYPKFNWAARKLHKRLAQLGAREVYPRGEADEQHPEGIDGTFLSWSVDLRKHLLSLYPLPDGISPIPIEVLLPPKFTLQLLESTPESAGSGDLPTFHSSLDVGSNRELLDEKSLTSGPSRLPLDNAADKLTSSNSLINENNSTMQWTPPAEQEVQFCPQLKDALEGEVSSVDLTFPPRDLISHPDAFEVKLIENKRVTPENHWQDVRLLTFIMGDEHVYEPGDVISIFPKNFPEDVQTLIDLMDWNAVADIPLQFKPTHPKYFLSTGLVSLTPGLYPVPHSTLRKLLTHNLDITAIPKRYFFEFISHWTDDPMHKERLLEFTNPAFTDEFFDYTTRPRRSILEILADFPSVKIPFKFATSLLPVMRGRQFSICSGGILSKHHTSGIIKFQLLIAIVKYKTILRKTRQGLCSRYIASLPENTMLNVQLTCSESFYSLAHTTPKLPVIMIAPGTGVAPCRSLVWTRVALKFQDDGDVGESVLIFGGRNKSADFYFKEEWKLASLGLKVFTAFSRDQKEKVYVQDVVRREGKLLARLIGEGAVVYVCGSSGNMPKAVREALLDVMEQHGGPWEGGRVEVEEKLGFMEKIGLYVQETW